MFRTGLTVFFPFGTKNLKYYKKGTLTLCSLFFFRLKCYASHTIIREQMQGGSLMTSLWIFRHVVIKWFFLVTAG